MGQSPRWPRRHCRTKCRQGETPLRRHRRQQLLYRTGSASCTFDYECALYLADAELDKAFLSGAEDRGMFNLKGHRSVGGMRTSIYNAVPMAAVESLVNFMSEFENEHG